MRILTNQSRVLFNRCAIEEYPDLIVWRRDKDTCYDFASMNWLLGSGEPKSNPFVLI